MKVAYGLLAVLLLAVSFALPGTEAETGAPQDVDWLRALDEATRVAEESGRPLLVVFR